MLSNRTHTYYDCAERRSAISQLTAFADKEMQNTVRVGLSKDEAMLQWQDVAPDTADEDLLDFACSKAPK
jgi:hypothetical protein